MKYRLTLRSAWRYRDHKRNRRILDAGVYDVPDAVPLAVAELAVGQGVATMLKVHASAPPTAPVADKPGRGRKPKPPSNKSLGQAPENKSTLV